ncbi:hypothetical protein [Paenibacillus xylanexedens]|uniref:hypothetical protein n=1 Tax=Paenibacillus xylanexedens TaxID=528191 RepID=UPI0011A3EC0A|nr:hypothetical protein [Paenibacillus xylanexedens]
MNEDELLQMYGLEPDKKHRESIRRLLQQEMENREADDHEILKLLCIMLFAIGNVEDTELIWLAKRKNQNAGSYIDVQLLCGAGIEETIVYLEKKGGEQAHKQLLYLRKCEPYDFVDFSKDQWLSEYKAYYGV